MQHSLLFGVFKFFRTHRAKRSFERGFTLLETMVVITIASILMGTAIASLREFNRPALNAADQIRSLFKQVRAKAISQTASYRVSGSSSEKITTSYADKCSSSTFANDQKLFLDMPEGAILQTTGWTVCINPRGIADTNVIMRIKGSDGTTKRVEVMLGGATRVL